MGNIENDMVLNNGVGEIFSFYYYDKYNILII